MEKDELHSQVNEVCDNKCGLQDETEETTKNTLLFNSNGVSSDQENIHSEVKNYLDQVNSFVSESFDPKLKREYKKLTELLLSYKKLNDKLNRECGGESKKNAAPEALKRSPEIRAILQPEIYADIREIEKETLVSKFIKKSFHNDPVPRCYKAPPSFNLYDLRQIEKDRFAQVVSSASSRFHNLVPLKSQPVRRSLPTNAHRGSMEVENVREKEKDRLARIFATSIGQKKNVSKNNPKRPSLDGKKVEQNSNSKLIGRVSIAPEVNNKEPPPERKIEAESLEKLKEKSPDSPDNCGMVRAGEYSPLNTKDNPQGKHLLGFGEYEERRKLSLERRKKEYRDYITQVRQATKTKMDAQVSIEEGVYSEDEPKFRSASTQTDFESYISPRSAVDLNVQARRSQESNTYLPSAPLHPNIPSYSPREKLLSDLHGASDFFTVEHPHGFSSGEETRLKQMAYAEALRAQIEEKKRLEALKKQKEKEEEEMQERKAREQQERLQKEYQKEQMQRLDWMQQRAAQDELLRQRLLEMEIQTQELKKEERRKKRSQSHYDDTLHEEFNREDLQNPDVWLEDDNNRRLENITRTPLLDADPQNILSDKYYAHHSPRTLRVLPRTGVHSGAISPKSSVVYNPLYASMAENNTEVTPQRQRSLSPVIPALRTESLMKKNSQILNDKWMVPAVSSQGVSAVHQLPSDNGGMRRSDTILTQLGAFRRQLHLEHLKMQQRLETQPSQ